MNNNNELRSTTRQQNVYTCININLVGFKSSFSIYLFKFISVFTFFYFSCMLLSISRNKKSTLAFGKKNHKQ